MVDGAGGPGEAVVAWIQLVCIVPVADYQKHAREVLSDALRGCISGLYIADAEYGLIWAVGIKLRLIKFCGEFILRV
jgi:hypothetical protein